MADNSVASRVSATPEGADVLESLTGAEAALLKYQWKFWARPAQIAPPTDWGVWMLMTGRGFGKTRAGAEWIIEQAKTPGTRMALVGRIPADARDVMIGGESGIIPCSSPDFRPRYVGSGRCVRWPNGSEALIFSSESPDDLRGPNFHCAWVDELAKYRNAKYVWDMLAMGVRLPPNPRIVVTTTPRPIPIIKMLVDEDSTHVTTGTSYDNRANLSPKFFERLIKRYEGTYLGQQELEGLLLSDRPGAMWDRATLERNRVTTAPDMVRIVVAVDPPGTSSEETAEAGIVVVGRSSDGVGYLLADGSMHGTPHEWGTAAVRLHDEFKADGIVAESNQGGDMVGFTIRECAKTLHRDGERLGASIHYIPVHASRGKWTRAEPIAALYSQNRVRHVGMFAELEDQLASWVPGEKSPDRLDALVWGLTSILLYGSDDIDVWGGAGPREDSSHVIETATSEGGWFPPSSR